jgi:kynureninase
LTHESIGEAVAKIGPGPLTEDPIARYVRPLFASTLAGSTIYLANHTLGRPLDQMQHDVAACAKLWSTSLRDAWQPWLVEEQAYRAALASLLGLERPDCVIPKVSAGHALRAVLNTLPAGATVLTTREEFTSVAVVLAQYQAAGRLRVVFADRDGAALADALSQKTPVRLVVVSQVFCADAALLPHLPALNQACRVHGAALLVDCYHALGVLPVDMPALDCDYLIGGCYKYLRGGPGAAFLAITPRVAESVDNGSMRPLDTGWFALQPGENAWKPGGPPLRQGGDAWLEGTPPVLTYYQARSGLEFTRAIGVERLRAYSLAQLQYLKQQLVAKGIESTGGDLEHGAFLTVKTPDADVVVTKLKEIGVVIDARDGLLRICPDCLTTRHDIERAGMAIAEQVHQQS